MNYDVDKILQSGHEFITQLYNTFPHPNKPEYQSLSEVEKTLQGVAMFEVCAANGFNSLFYNSQFDVIEAAVRTTHNLGTTLLYEGLSELLQLCQKHGFPENISEWSDHYWNMTEKQDEQFQEDVLTLERKYYWDNKEKSLSFSPEHIPALKAYAEAHIDELRLRK